MQLPDGVELTLSELQDMAARQQQQIESHQQMLVAKEQRLKFLKQQEMRHQQLASENDRLRRLRERVEAQEMKLRKLRALRGQVDQQKMNNSSLTSELESIRSLFNEKEKELALAVAKVEELTKQLEEVRRGRLSSQVLGNNSSPAMIELEKLRRELLYRNKLNEQQNNKLAQQREALARGQEETIRIDKRIAELQQRLHRKRMLNQQLANQINAAASAKQAQFRASQSGGGGRNRTRPLSANIAAVEPFKHTPSEVSSSPVLVSSPSQIQQERAQDDLHAKLNSAKTEHLPEFQPNKNDPKYQTLPVNTKFPAKFVKSPGEDEIVNKSGKPNEQQLHQQQQHLQNHPRKSDDKTAAPSSMSSSSTSNSNGPPLPSQNGKPPPTQTVHSIPAYTPPKGHATAAAPQLLQMSQNQQQPSSVNPPSIIQPSYNTVPTPFNPTYGSSVVVTTPPHTFLSTSAAPSYVAPPPPPPPSSAPQHWTSGNLPNTPLISSTGEKPVGSTAPTSLPLVRPVISAPSQSRPPPPHLVYQTSSTHVPTTATPHTLSVQSQGKVKDLNDSSSWNSGGPEVQLVAGSAFEVATTTISPLQPHDGFAESSLELSALSGGGAAEDSASKPSLPPKPSIPLKPTPPPRQIHQHMSPNDREKVDTSPEALDSALNILKGSPASAASSSASAASTAAKGNQYRYAPRNVIADTYTQQKQQQQPPTGGNALYQYLRNISQQQSSTSAPPTSPPSAPLDDVTAESSSSSSAQQSSVEEENESGSRKVSSNDLPIKPKPLTIKKHLNADPPKLKVVANGNVSAGLPRKQSVETVSTSNNNNNNNNNVVNNNNNNNSVVVGNVGNGGGNNRAAGGVHISINRRIEMPPAFLFPENEAPPPDLNASANPQPPSTGFADTAKSASAVDAVDNKTPLYPLAPPPYPVAEGDTAWESSKTWNEENKRHSALAPTVDGDDKVAPPVPSVVDLGGVKTDGEKSMADRENVTILETENERNLEKFNEATDTLTVSIQDQEENENSTSTGSPSSGGDGQQSTTMTTANVIRRGQKGNLKMKGSTKSSRRVSFDPLALLLDASLEGELELVKKTAREVPNPSAANDEGITALHNAICAGHFEIVKFLVQFGCDVNAQDSDGWTPLHCAASCNNLPMVKFLVEHGACIFATTLSDHETAAEKCEEDEEGFDGCSEYLYSIQEKLGIMNNGAVYALYEYDAQNQDELGFKDADMMIVLRKGDEFEREWWWSKFQNKEGYIPRNLLGLYPRVGVNKDV